MNDAQPELGIVVELLCVAAGDGERRGAEVLDRERVDAIAVEEVLAVVDEPLKAEQIARRRCLGPFDALTNSHGLWEVYGRNSGEK